MGSSIEAGTNRFMEKKDGKMGRKKTAKGMGRPRSAKEPDVYKAVTKTCPFCSSVDVEFKFLNNNKFEQPRYKCLVCKKLFTYNPSSRRKRHPQGYLKIASNDVAAQSLPDNATVMCLNPSCGKLGTSRFLFYNNGKVEQPRYKCGACDTTFTHGGRLSLKRIRQDLPMADDVRVCSTAAGELVRLKRKFEESVQDVGENSERLNVRRADDTCGIEATTAEQPKNLRNTKKIHLLNNGLSTGDDEDKTTRFNKTLELCSWCESLQTLRLRSCVNSVLLEIIPKCQDCCGFSRYMHFLNTN